LKIKLKLILQKEAVNVWNGFNWYREGSIAVLLCKWQLTWKNAVSWIAELHINFSRTLLHGVNYLINTINQWYSAWGMRRHLRGYVQSKIYIYYFMINTLINNG
jgi:hypothetical protein